MKIPDTGKVISGIYIAAALIGLFLVYKIFSGVGLIKTGAKKKAEAEKDAASDTLRTLDYFNPKFLDGKLSKYTPLGKTTAGAYAAELKSALKGFGTDEEKIFSVFGRLQCKYNISEVALNYQVNFKSDLLTDLLNDLTPAEKLTLINIIEKLPETNFGILSGTINTI